jgi:RND family efflux transporter MFP subunit
MRTLRRSPGLAAVALCVSLFTAGCGGPGGTAFGRGPDGEAEESEVEATPVVTGLVKAGPIEAQLVAASTIEAERQVTVHAESTGRILTLTAEEGDDVKEGKLLARIKYDSQSAGLDRASTSLTKAQSDLDIVRELYAQRVASKEELDAAELALETAQLDIADRRRDVRNTKVVAPLSGVVVERFVSEGAFVTSGAQLVTIVDFSTLVARVFVPEKELDRIAEGQAAEVVGKAAQGRRGTGKILRIAPVVDAATGTVKVTVALPAELAGGDGGFLPGMYAEVTLTTERRERAVLVSKEALVWDEEQAFVFVTAGDKVERRAIELGLSDAEHSEVLRGLQIGTEVVIVGHAGLKDGAPIRRVDRTGSAVDASPAVEGSDLAERDEPPAAEGA